jgi:ribonuclease HI
MAKIVENASLVYTDGSLYPVGRRGGLAIVFVHVDSVGVEVIVDTHSPPGGRGTTNNRMELQAAIEGLKRVIELPQFSLVPLVVVRTDSRYVTNYFDHARSYWRRNGWCNLAGRPVENAEVRWKA